MIWVFIVIAALIVFAIAAVTVGREAFRLAHQPPATIVDIEEAVHHVADGLPASAQARLTYDEVRELIVAELDHLRAKGLSARPGEELPESAGDGALPIVIDDDDAVAAVLGHVSDAGLDVVDEDVVRVVDALHDYLADIGAVGPKAPGADQT